MPSGELVYPVDMVAERFRAILLTRAGNVKIGLFLGLPRAMLIKLENVPISHSGIVQRSTEIFQFARRQIHTNLRDEIPLVT